MATEVLKAAYGGVTRHFCLVAGDCDFIPLIDCLVDMGMKVDLWHHRRAAEEMKVAADTAQVLEPKHIFSCIRPKAKTRLDITLPIYRGGPGEVTKEKGSWEDKVYGTCKWGDSPSGGFIAYLPNGYLGHEWIEARSERSLLAFLADIGATACG